MSVCAYVSVCKYTGELFDMSRAVSAVGCLGEAIDEVLCNKLT